MPRRASSDALRAADASTEEVLDVYSVSEDEAIPVHIDLTGASDEECAEADGAAKSGVAKKGPQRADGARGAPGAAASPAHSTPAPTSDAISLASDLDSDDMDDVAVDDELDMDDVDIDTPQNAYASLYDVPAEPAPQGAPLQVVVARDEPKSTPKKRTTQWTPRDRKNRVLVHQLQVLAVLAAARIRNRWCNDAELRETLLDAVPDHLLHKLYAIHPKREPERRERVRLFEAFMHDLVRWWASRFRLHATQSAACAWRQPCQDLLLGTPLPPHTWVDGWLTESPAERARRQKTPRKKREMEVALFPPGGETATPTYLRLLPCDAPKCASDLVEAAHARLGTHETSAQLFCALCRALGVPARLVVSVQAAPCTAAAAKTPGARSREPRPTETVVSSDEEPAPRTRRRAEKSGYYIEPVDARGPPTVWVEVFSKPYQHWITVDPIRALVRVTGSKHMEPVATNKQNRLVYVVGFEEDGYARDVTARYTRVLHTKVARQRPAAVARNKALPSTPEDWWGSVVRALHRPQRLDRDAAEDVELADQAAREPMPTSLGAFKDHPVYVLEQFLRRDQVIHPLHRVGTFQGKPVYLRANVLTLQSARQWYNQGREIVEGEQALKVVKARGYTLMSKRMEEQARADGQEEATEGLYAYHQTRVYTPPPVVDGRVPTNGFGNIDLFVPSMLPAGGLHIPHAGAAKAAKSLGIGYAEAVVGFEFRKFRSLPRLAGAVIPKEHADQVWEAIRHAEKQAAETEQAKRQARAIKGWRKLLTALTVAKHVQQQYGTAKATTPHDAKPQLKERLRETEARHEQKQLQPLPIAPREASDESEDEAPQRPARPIVSLDELIAADARASEASTPQSDLSTASPASPAPLPAPKRRRIVLKRSAPAEPAPRRSTRRAATAAAAAMYELSESDDDIP